ncbi:hypothetical protein C8J57DRAFT_161660 [Mycena rebaudengoi]|nr:hypothetical protein C8J57DRAFT_161660 [Mycena rebaudengoi]
MFNRSCLPAPNLDPRRQIQSWATWQPDPSMASPPSAEPPLLVPTQPSPGLFGPRSPRYADPPVALRRLSAEPPLLVPESTSPGLFGPRPLGESWATWRPDASMPPSPPSVEPTLLLPHSNSPGLFGPRSPRDWEARHG